MNELGWVIIVLVYTWIVFWAGEESGHRHEQRERGSRG